jgi:hypothetical protein
MVASNEPTKERRMAAEGAEGASGDPGPRMDSGPDPIMLEPTEAELNDWAARERKRRQEWVNGPSTEERAEWARRERMRRLSGLSDEDRDLVMAEWARQVARYPREMQLAFEGMFSVFYRWSRRQMNEFVAAGRDWEDQVVRTGRRARIRLNDDDEA